MKIYDHSPSRTSPFRQQPDRLLRPWAGDPLKGPAGPGGGAGLSRSLRRTFSKAGSGVRALSVSPRMHHGRIPGGIAAFEEDVGKVPADLPTDNFLDSLAETLRPCGTRRLPAEKGCLGNSLNFPPFSICRQWRRSPDRTGSRPHRPPAHRYHLREGREPTSVSWSFRKTLTNLLRANFNIVLPASKPLPYERSSS